MMNKTVRRMKHKERIKRAIGSLIGEASCEMYGFWDLDDKIKQVYRVIDKACQDDIIEQEEE